MTSNNNFVILGIFSHSQLNFNGNEKGPDAQSEQFRQMLSQHMVIDVIDSFLVSIII